MIVARSLEDAGAPIKVSLIEARTTLKTPVLAAKAEHRERRLIYLAIDTQHGRGMGELATVEQPSWGDPTTEAVLAHLVELAIPRLFEAAAARENQARRGLVRFAELHGPPQLLRPQAKPVDRSK